LAKVLYTLLFLLLRLVWWFFCWVAFLDREERVERWVAGVWLGLACGLALSLWGLGFWLSDLNAWLLSVW
jgi:hypothetical protein